MNGDRFFWTRSGRERRRKNFLIISRISRKKKTFQRHEANEKRDGMISSWARSGRKDLVFLRKKDRGFFSEEEKKSKTVLSVVVDSAWDSGLISTMMKM
jgi:hypothetical protein